MDYKITNGQVSYIVIPIGEYINTLIKEDGSYLKRIDPLDSSKETIYFSDYALTNFMIAMNMWVVADSLEPMPFVHESSPSFSRFNISKKISSLDADQFYSLFLTNDGRFIVLHNEGNGYWSLASVEELLNLSVPNCEVI